ncbi:aspartate aminotransferase, cytoplasmic-like [Centruroides sculpturatus]|uniref:aspartate aminotransferase, cytoplasmic-like n=1 Tax=Centruroides sculpturatus TaxID=218467 RepID=UPI000C6D2E8B|nr:aspartate aminotransferase, cytoplasmic-like [Centruroides sculpturatus]
MLSFNFSSVYNVESQEPIELFELAKEFQDDNYPQKVNLSIGVYRTEEGKHWVLPVVKRTEKILASENALSHEYLGQTGFYNFTQASLRFLLGNDHTVIRENRVLGIQTVSGTGALRMGAEFLTKCLNYRTFYMSEPSWPSHHIVFPLAGFQDIKRYRYWDSVSKGLDLKGMKEDLQNAPEKSIILLHVCGHNPTGVDLNQDQWKIIADVMEEKNHFPFFDCAYQGFVSGDWEVDGWPVRYFASRGFELFCAQSFSKNFGLYGERIGNLAIVFNNPLKMTNVKSQFTYLIRGNYSNPPSYGAKIVEYILNNEELFNEWKLNIKTMSNRIKEIRVSLYEKLKQLETVGNWSYFKEHTGMFSLSGITGNSFPSFLILKTLQ